MLDQVSKAVASNALLTALANLGGVISLILLALAAARYAYKFLRAAYVESIPAAIRSQKKFYRRTIVRSASNPYNYTYYIISRSGTMFAFAMISIVTLFVSSAVSTTPLGWAAEAGIKSPAIIGQLNAVVGTLFGYASAFIAIRLMKFSRLVTRRRAKVMKRFRRQK